MTPEDLIPRFHLAPLTGEGGLYRRTYCSARELPAEAFGPQYPAGTRKAAGSAIEYLITPQSYSRLHRLPTDEVYHFYLGDPVALFLIPPQGPPRTVLLGQDVLSGMEVQFVVPAGWWQGSRLLDGGQWAFLGTTMAPAYTDADYTDADADALCRAYPDFAREIRLLTAPPQFPETSPANMGPSHL